MDLDFDLTSSSGRPETVSGAVVRELAPADLALLQADRGVQPAPLKRLRHRHHALARAIASGMKDIDAALITGYDPSRVSILKADPTFKELITFYMQKADAPLVEFNEKLFGAANTALDILQERMEDTPDDLSINQLHETVKMGADRTGYGPATTSTQLNVHVDISKRLEAARKRVSERKLIDITPEVQDGN